MGDPSTGSGQASPARIRLLPDDTPAPAPAPFPSGQARRWRSPFDLAHTVPAVSPPRCTETGAPRRTGAPGPNGVSYREGRPFDGEVDEAAVEVFVTPRAYVRVCAHAGSDLYHEVGGALVGVRRLDPERGTAFVVVEAVVPAQHTRHGPSYLTFTQDSLVAIHDDLDRRYPGREFVGWYHTHPGMGVFLSGYDVWLHEHFFPAAWQVALVIEPRVGEGGFFVRGRDGTLDPRAYRGFYELLRKGRESVMRWTNLSADGDGPTGLEQPEAEAGPLAAGGG